MLNSDSSVNNINAMLLVSPDYTSVRIFVIVEIGNAIPAIMNAFKISESEIRMCLKIRIYLKMVLTKGYLLDLIIRL